MNWTSLFRKLTIGCLTFVFLSCQTQTVRERAPQSMTLAPVPTSHVNMKVSLPVKELEIAINRMLKKEVLRTNFHIGKKQDSIELVINRTRKIDMAFRKNELYVSMPVSVSAVVKKKVMGLRILGEDKPIEFDAIAQLKTSITLLDDWNLSFDCQWLGLIWETSPQITMLGITFNLEKMVEEKLLANKVRIESEICNALHEKVQFRDIISQVYGTLGKPKPILKQHGPLYFQMQPGVLRGSWRGYKRDTITVQIESEMSFAISSIGDVPMVQPTLGKRKDVLSKNSNFTSYVEVLLGTKELEKLAGVHLIGKSFQYEEYSAKIKSINIFTKDQKLHVRLKFEGDVSSTVVAWGIPSLTEDQQLFITKMSYEIEEGDQWLKLANMAFQSTLETYLENIVKFDAAPFFDQLPGKINDGIAASPMGKKMSLKIDFEKVRLFDQGMNDKFIQFIFQVEGDADLLLKREVFESNELK